MAVTGKTGADAIFQAVAHICRVISKYHDKLIAVIDAAYAAGAITVDQRATLRLFVDGATDACTAWRLLANYSGF